MIRHGENHGEATVYIEVKVACLVKTETEDPSNGNPGSFDFTLGSPEATISLVDDCLNPVEGSEMPEDWQANPALKTAVDAAMRRIAYEQR